MRNISPRTLKSVPVGEHGTLAWGGRVGRSAEVRENVRRLRDWGAGVVVAISPGDVTSAVKDRDPLGALRRRQTLPLGFASLGA